MILEPEEEKAYEKKSTNKKPYSGKTQEAREDSNGCLELAERGDWLAGVWRILRTRRPLFMIPQLGPYIIIDLSEHQE